MKSKLYYLAILIVLALLAARQSFALSLDEAIGKAESNSHELKEQKLELESMGWSEKKAFSGFLPKLEVQASHVFAEKFQVLDVNFGGSEILFPEVTPFTDLSLTASYEILSGFRSVNQLEATRFARQATEQKLGRAEEQLHSGIRTLFYKALGSQVLVDVSDESIKTLESHRNDVNSRVRGGISTRFDTLRVEVQLEEAKTNKISAENSVVINRAKLFEAMGVADDGSKLAGVLPQDYSQLNLSEIDAQNADRKDRKAAMMTTQSSERMERASQAHWLPQFSVFASEDWYDNYNYSVAGSEAHFKDAYSVGVLLKWNLYDGGASYASEKQAAISKQVNEEKLAHLNDAIPVEIEESKRRLTYDITNYKAKISSVHKAEEAVRLARGALRAGTLTNTEVLDAVLDLNRAKAEAVKAQIDAIDALGQLELAVGHRLEAQK